MSEAASAQRRAPMARGLRAQAAERLINEVAARRALRGLMIELEEAGYPREAADAVSSAFEQVLLGEPGYRERAERAMREAGLMNGFVVEVMNYLDRIEHKQQPA